MFSTLEPVMLSLLRHPTQDETTRPLPSITAPLKRLDIGDLRPYQRIVAFSVHCQESESTVEQAAPTPLVRISFRNL